jgi:hypothetical protein
MAFEFSPPDLSVSMFPDPCAPRAARYCVSIIERPPPELRESVVLLTSELVSRAVRFHQATSHEFFELRVWMRSDMARVELRGAHELVCAKPRPDDYEDDLLLFDAFADRWSIDVDERGASIWFEIDRDQESNGPSGPWRSIFFPRFRDTRRTAEPWARRRRGCIPVRPARVSAKRRGGIYGVCSTR